MPTVLENAPVLVDHLPPRKKWTRAELDRLEELHLIDTTNYELVEGDLFSLMGKNRPHSDFVAILVHYLSAMFGFRFVNTESPVELTGVDRESSQPQPDLFVLRSEFRDFRGAIPNAENLALVVEVADSSLAFDLTTKAGLYARAGIAEYWVVDIQGRRVLGHREPRNGTYESIKAYGPEERIVPLASSGAALDLKNIFEPEK